MKICSKCNIKKDKSLFYKGNGADGLHYWCIDCFKKRNNQNYIKNKDRFLDKAKIRRTEKKEEIKKCINEWKKKNKHKLSSYFAKRRASKLNATVKWANNFYISEIYKLAILRTKMTGIQWHVDHIVPLVNKSVCGLHCEQNLQVIPAVENLRKGNGYEI